MKFNKSLIWSFILIFIMATPIFAMEKYKKCPRCGEVNYKIDKEKDINYCFKCGKNLKNMKYKLRNEKMIIDEVLKRKIKDLGDPKKLSAAEWYQRGDTSEDILSKMACFYVSLKVKEIPGIHNNLGTIYQKKMMIEEAEKEYKQAIKLDKNYAIAYNNLATIYINMGKFKDAKREIDNALRVDPGNVIFIKTKGDILCAQKKYKEAANLYRKVLRKDKDGVASRVASFKLDMVNMFIKK